MLVKERAGPFDDGRLFLLFLFSTFLSLSLSLSLFLSLAHRAAALAREWILAVSRTSLSLAWWWARCYPCPRDDAISQNG